MPENAYRDENSVPTLIASSNVDGKTPVRLYADPVTHRLLVDLSASGALTLLDATGTINDSNLDFTFTMEPTVLVINGLTYKKTGGSITWTWTGGTLTASLSVPIGTGGSIFGMI